MQVGRSECKWQLHGCICSSVPMHTQPDSRPFGRAAWAGWIGRGATDVDHEAVCMGGSALIRSAEAHARRSGCRPSSGPPRCRYIMHILPARMHALQDIAPFRKPKVDLEQYPTGPDLASRLLFTVRCHAGPCAAVPAAPGTLPSGSHAVPACWRRPQRKMGTVHSSQGMGPTVKLMGAARPMLQCRALQTPGLCTAPPCPRTHIDRQHL